MSDRLFRFNAQVGVALSGHGLRFFLDFGDHQLESYAIPTAKVAEFIVWLRTSGGLAELPLFSARLDAACVPHRHTGIASRLAQRLRVGFMCVHHWRRAQALPSTEQAVQIAEFFGWSVERTLFELESEKAIRASKQRRRPAGKIPTNKGCPGLLG
jgi:hypothetical protein